jgi:hypothetical protein
MPPDPDLFTPVQAIVVGAAFLLIVAWLAVREALREPVRTCRFCGHSLRADLECAKTGWQCRDTHACIGRERSKPNSWWRN